MRLHQILDRVPQMRHLMLVRTHTTADYVS